MNPSRAESLPIHQPNPAEATLEKSKRHQAHERPPLPDLAAEVRRLSARFSELGPDWRRSAFQLLTTALPFFALLVLMDAAASVHYGLTLLLAVPAAGLLVRLFIMQHDCGHASFFRSRAANEALGRLLAVLTLTPYGHWKRGHTIHHASSGNLDRRGRGDVDTLTVAEYLALSPMKQWGYRLYRNPLVQVLVGAPLNFIILQRIPRAQSFRDRDSRRSILALNAALLVAFGVPMLLIGPGRVLAAYLPVIIVAAWIGNWLFYVQHQFDGAYWERGGDWDFKAAALQGSSYFELPAVLRWFSGNIGLHHIHHLCSRVPNYHLQACLESAPQLSQIARRITLRDSMSCWRLALWDEQHRALVSFRHVERSSARQQ